MRRILAFTLVLIGLMAPIALAQQLYTHDKVDYSFDLPSPTWKTILEQRIDQRVCDEQQELRVY